VNEYPFGKNLVKTDRSNNVNLFVELLKSSKHQFRLNATYRNLEVLRPDVTSQKSDNSLLSRGEYVVNEWKGFLTGNVLYELVQGRNKNGTIVMWRFPPARENTPGTIITGMGYNS
jgi:hypothetical protein